MQKKEMPVLPSFNTGSYNTIDHNINSFLQAFCLDIVSKPKGFSHGHIQWLLNLFFVTR
jgi:hypothetical protein